MTANTRDEALLEIVARHVGRTSTIYRYIRDDFAALAAPVEAAPPAGAVEDAARADSYDSWQSIAEDMTRAARLPQSQHPPLSYWKSRVCALAALATPAARQSREAGTAIALTGLRQYRYEASVSKTQSVEIGIESLDCMIAALSARPAAGDGEAAKLRGVIERIKYRLHFMHWPGESYWNAGTDEKPHWIPDWRYEIALIENALHGTPITAPEKPGDTKRANEITAPPAREGVPEGLASEQREAIRKLVQRVDLDGPGFGDLGSQLAATMPTLRALTAAPTAGEGSEDA